MGLSRHAALAIANASLYQRSTQALAAANDARDLASAQALRLRRLDEHHTRLTDVMLEGAGLDRMVGTLADLFGGSVWVLHPMMRVIAVAGNPVDRAGRGVRKGSNLRRGGMRFEIEAARGRLSKGASVVLEGASGKDPIYTVAPILGGVEILGSVWTVSESASDWLRPAVEQAARVVALQLLQERALLEVERRLGRELLDELLRGHSEIALERSAREAGVDLNRPLRLAVIAAQALGEGHSSRTTLAKILGPLRTERWCALAAEHGDRLVMLIDQDVPDAAAQLERLLGRLGPEIQTRGVLSPPCDSRVEFRMRFEACCRTLDVFGERLTATVTDLSHARLLTLLFGSGREHEASEFVTDVIGATLEYDAEHNTALTDTLEAYLGCQASPSRTSTVLHVHVNTLYYRLGRIRELLGEDFDSPQRAVDLRVALAARRLLGLEKSSN
jgi:sugar diacid utilization regulator